MYILSIEPFTIFKVDVLALGRYEFLCDIIWNFHANSNRSILPSDPSLFFVNAFLKRSLNNIP